MPKPKKYRSGTITKTDEGTWLAYIRVNGQRKRERFKKELEAKGFIDQWESQLLANVPKLETEDTIDAFNALKELREGTTLLDAVRYYNENHLTNEKRTVGEALEQFLKSKRDSNRATETVRMYRYRLKKLPTNQELQQITVTQCEDILGKISHAQTRENHRVAFVAFFNWCIKRHWLVKNPMDGIDRLITDRELPKCFTVDQTKRLLNAALEKHPEIVAELAIGFFAGLRPSETGRLAWSQIDDEEIRIIRSKTRHRMRYIKIEPNLREWLALVRPKNKTWRVCRGKKETRRAALLAVRKHAKVTWIDDGLRHSFASYHLAANQNLALTVDIMGHTSPKMLFEHYRKLVSKSAAEDYFSIVPDASKIPILSQRWKSSFSKSLQN